MPRPSCSIEMPVSSWKAAKASIRRFVSTPPKSLITARSCRVAHAPASISYDPSAGTPSSLKRNSVSDAAARRERCGDAAGGLAREPAGQLVPGPEQLGARLHRQAVLAEHRRQPHGLERQRPSPAPSPARACGRRPAPRRAPGAGRLDGGDRQRIAVLGRGGQEARAGPPPPAGPQRCVRRPAPRPCGGARRSRRSRAPRTAARSGAARRRGRPRRWPARRGRRARSARRSSSSKRAPGASSDSVQRSSGCSIVSCSGPAAARSQLSTPVAPPRRSRPRSRRRRARAPSRSPSPAGDVGRSAPRAAATRPATDVDDVRNSPGPVCACSSAGSVIAAAGRAASGGSSRRWRRRRRVRGGLRPWPRPARRADHDARPAEPRGRSIMRVSRRRNAARVGGISRSSPMRR